MCLLLVVAAWSRQIGAKISVLNEDNCENGFKLLKGELASWDRCLSITLLSNKLSTLGSPPPVGAIHEYRVVGDVRGYRVEA